MKTPVLLLLISISAAMATVYRLGPTLTLPLLVSVLCVVVALGLLVSTWVRRPRRWMIIDGSNVMHWNPQNPTLHPVGCVVDILKREGYSPVVGFDANAGYLVSGRYMGRDRLAGSLGMPARRVFVAPSGTPADPLLLEKAARLNGRVVTNDRFRDWAETHPEVLQAGYLIKGRVEGGVLSLDLED